MDLASIGSGSQGGSMSRPLFASLAAVAALTLAGSAHAAVLVYQTDLSGPAESPPNASPGTGFATVTIDDAGHQMRVQVNFSGLLSPTTASHIHCCTAAAGTGTAGVATQVPTFAGFPLGVTSGTYDQTFDTLLAGTYNPAFVTANVTVAGAEAALFGGLAAGTTYVNIHTNLFPNGEIRGFLSAIPEPGTWALMLLGFGLAGAALRHRKVAVAA
jgi:hypothetical protein